MLCKLVFLSALLFGLTAAESPYPRLHVRHGLKISSLSGDALIQPVCQGVGDNEAECVSILKSAPPDQKADAKGLAFFTLRFVENHAENITAGIQKISEIPERGPLLDSALSDCMDQYNSVDDLIENAINSLLSNKNSDAQQFVIAAFTSIEMCDSQLTACSVEEKKENKVDESVHMEKDLKKYNLLHKNLLAAALNILTAD